MDQEHTPFIIKVQNHPNLTTKNFLLFAFKILWLKDSLDDIIWKNPSPNSPFATRPVAILALAENRDNIVALMDSTINSESKLLKDNGVQLSSGKVNVDITRCLFDTKMAGILDGAGGACCHLCTALKEELSNIDLIHQGFPINRTIESAKEIFDELGEEELLALPHKERFGITAKPLSDINILSVSPLHGYLRVFGWFMQLVYHLQAGEKKWAPTSPKIRQSMNFVRSFLWEKINIHIDFPSPQGGTTSTGNVARSCFQRVDDSKKDFFYWIITLIPFEYHIPLDIIYTNLAVVLRIFNCDELVDIPKFSTLCKDTYQLIIETFPWASITPTLHKVLAHSAQLVDQFNGGRGMKSFSEEGLEACHKHIRRYREQLARKISFEANIKDIFIRLLSQSDFFSFSKRKLIGSKRAKRLSTQSSKNEQLFESLVFV